VTVADVERSIARAFPTEWAEEWDRNGLACGDPKAKVTGVLVTLDPTRAAVARASRLGANVLVTHHPPYLEPPQAVRPGPGPGGVVFAAVQGGIAIVNAHTNLDRAPAAQGALADILGLEPVRAVERELQPMALITTFVPVEAVDRVQDAMVAAGAGRIGEYDGCAFAGEGIGSFTPRADANPGIGTPGERYMGQEARIEMVAPPGLAKRVVEAVRTAHLYEEPLITVADVRIARSVPRMGTMCRARVGTTLGSLARSASRKFKVRPRVWGDPTAKIELVVTATGSAGSLIPDAVQAGAQVLIAGEVRYHDAMGAIERGLSVIELGHDMSEWPLVPILADAVLATRNIEAELVRMETPFAGWWTP
jgi:dinuclear metal center YbgI/SA1388 family protein